MDSRNSALAVDVVKLKKILELGEIIIDIC
jgi:hypothetical protein